MGTCIKCSFVVVGQGGGTCKAAGAGCTPDNYPGIWSVSIYGSNAIYKTTHYQSMGGECIYDAPVAGSPAQVRAREQALILLLFAITLCHCISSLPRFPLHYSQEFFNSPVYFLISAYGYLLDVYQTFLFA